MNNSVIGLAILVAAFSPCAGSVPRGLTVSSVHAVDNHDQLELPIPRAAGADVLIGQQRAEALTAIIDPAGSAERPDRLLLRVDFRSGVDLREAAGRSLVIFLTSYFCNRPKDFAILSSPTVYSHGHAVRDNDLPTGQAPNRKATAGITTSTSASRERRAWRPSPRRTASICE